MDAQYRYHRLIGCLFQVLGRCGCLSLICCFMFQVEGRSGHTVQTPQSDWVASFFRFGGGVDAQYRHHNLIGCFMFQVWGRCGCTVQTPQSDWLLHVTGLGEVWTPQSELVASCFRFGGGMDAQHRRS